MTQSTFANGRGIAHKGSGGMSIAFPDVCKTPAGPAVVPIPYPNVGKSADTSGGPATVTIDGKMPMVQGATYSTSTGDEAGTAGGGVVSNRTKAPCEFIVVSFDVLCEGKGVARLGDPLFHNQKNAAG
jgi:uncharacterized Zn-binding protein involved in type VI secretion